MAAMAAPSLRVFVCVCGGGEVEADGRHTWKKPLAAMAAPSLVTAVATASSAPMDPICTFRVQIEVCVPLSTWFRSDSGLGQGVVQSGLDQSDVCVLCVCV